MNRATMDSQFALFIKSKNYSTERTQHVIIFKFIWLDTKSTFFPKALGHRILDFPDGPASGELGLDREWEAAFAGVFPIGVPAFIDGHTDDGADRIIGRNFCLLGDP